MAFSEKQDLFINYLLKKIGFENEDLISNYKVKLEMIYGKYYKNWRTITSDNGNSYEQYYYSYSVSDCIDEVLKEIEIKKNLGSITLLKLNENSKISATDLSSFDFCPVSFSINKSFKIEYPTNEDKRNIGVNLHETLRLIDKKIPKDFTGSDYVNNTVSENITIKKIKKCELVFSGHTKDKRFFENKDKNFIGQPDYIFKDPNGQYFVVEEKFKYLNNYINPDDYNAEEIIKKRNIIKNTFFSNHIVQLTSYIDYIKNYEIKYGILIYWFYDFDNEIPFVHSVSSKVIKNKEYSQLLENTLVNINEFIAKKDISLIKKINPNKCAACVVNKYCAHKTGELNNLKIPYNRYYMKLKFVPFPEELKKKENNEENTTGNKM